MTTRSRQDLAYLPYATPPCPHYSEEEYKLVYSSGKVAYSNKNPRSASLPIQRTPEERKRVPVANNEPSLETRREYAHATWRMYRRIVCYRESHPLPDCYYFKSPHHSDPSSPLRFDPSGSQPSTNDDCEEHYDDEVMPFEMDM